MVVVNGGKRLWETLEVFNDSGDTSDNFLTEVTRLPPLPVDHIQSHPYGK